MSIFALILASVMYIFMIVMNTLANSLPLNGITTGAVSFKYPNLFQPAGITFSIWGLIYILLLVYLVYQFINFKNLQDNDTKQLSIRINLLFALTSLLNGLWLLSWHYDKMILSTVIMVGLLVALIFLVKISAATTLINRAPFSVYLGWITIATIANVAIMLVQAGVPSFDSNAISLTVGILLIGFGISVLWIVREKDFIFGFVIIWAYLGILIRHLKQENLSGLYSSIYITVIICLIFLIATNSYVIFKSLK